ncbi:TTPAL-like protein [Mya arenaria]|uniref:TTPAL-like protein n=1 Tax=Mya arenaria TaxID=6604 RepID=A0ABY7F045_MYAAR|nr:TTPAL-like protein [Mya arenaria]
MDYEEGDREYVNLLEESSRRICKEELHERNDADTLIAVQTFRKWIKEHKTLKTPTDKLDVELLKTVGLHTLYKACSLVLDWLIYDEHVQVEGQVMVVDFRGLTFNVFKAMFNKDMEEKYTDYFHRALPNRMNSIEVVNEPKFFDLVWAMIAPIMPQEMKDRFHMHGGSLVKIYEEVGYECLPEEYLPDDYDGPKSGTCDEIVEAMLEDMRQPEFLEYIRDLSSGKYGVDKMS